MMKNTKNAGLTFTYMIIKQKREGYKHKIKGANSPICSLQISLVCHFRGAHPAITVESDEIFNIIFCIVDHTILFAYANKFNDRSSDAAFS
jgi:hypothetical protein